MQLPRTILNRPWATFILCLIFALGVYLLAGHGGHYFEGFSFGMGVLAFVVPFYITKADTKADW